MYMKGKKMELIELVVAVVFSGMLLNCMAQGNNIKYYDFVLKETFISRLCGNKSILLVNGEFPGPVIHVNKGDIIYVNVHNHGNYGVTIHWHGVKQPRNPWSDGPVFVTQCPILPGSNFTYEVIFSKEEGTLWWHAHSDWTRNSVHGAIVISPAVGNTYPFPAPDHEQVLVFGSWFTKDIMSLVAYDIGIGGELPLTDALLINGQPGDLKPCSEESTFRMHVDYGKKYLLRLVNAAMNTDLFFEIANHNLTVVGWDAAYVKPVTGSYIFISPGQTMDVLVTANQVPSEYYMTITPSFNGGNNLTTAIFQYSGKYTSPVTPYLPSNLPDYQDVKTISYFTTSLRSLASPQHPVHVPLEVDTRMFITVSMNMNPCVNQTCVGPDGSRLLASLNNHSFVNPSIDILDAYLSNSSGIYGTDFPDKPEANFNFTADVMMSNNYTLTNQDTQVKVLEYNETVEIVFQGTNTMGSEDHPIHLHGFRFYVVGTGVGNFNNETDPFSFNFVDPPGPNTVIVPKNGWAVIRFRANNPGVWLMHCHFDRHLSWGMNTVFIVKNGNTTESSIREAPTGLPFCHENNRHQPILHQLYFNGGNGNLKELGIDLLKNLID